MSTKVIFLGGKPTSALCLRHLFEKQTEFNFKISAVYPRPKDYRGWWRGSRDSEEVYEVAQELCLPIILSKEELLEIPADVGISLLFYRIFDEDEILHFPKGIVNFHPAPLPYYRGANAVSHSIINGDEKFGVSLHFIDMGVDKGDLIDVLWFNVHENTTAHELYHLAVENIILLFDKWLERIVRHDLPSERQNDICDRLGIKPEYHSRKSLDNIRELDINWDAEIIIRYIRAFDFPPFEPAYVRLAKKKVYMRLGY